MKQMTPAAVERAMKLQDVMLRAMAKRITWYQAAEILGISGRQMLRWQTRFKHEGYGGLFDRRKGRPSPKRVPLQTVEEVLRLYQEQYFDFNVRHFHEKLVEEHDIKLSYTWVKLALQGAGLVKKGRKRGVHRKRRPRRPLPGMLLHIDASQHQWFCDSREKASTLVDRAQQLTTCRQRSAKTSRAPQEQGVERALKLFQLGLALCREWQRGKQPLFQRFRHIYFPHISLFHNSGSAGFIVSLRFCIANKNKPNCRVSAGILLYLRAWRSRGTLSDAAVGQVNKAIAVGHLCPTHLFLNFLVLEQFFN